MAQTPSHSSSGLPGPSGSHGKPTVRTLQAVVMACEVVPRSSLGCAGSFEHAPANELRPSKINAIENRFMNPRRFDATKRPERHTAHKNLVGPGVGPPQLGSLASPLTGKSSCAD